MNAYNSLRSCEIRGSVGVKVVCPWAMHLVQQTRQRFSLSRAFLSPPSVSAAMQTAENNEVPWISVPHLSARGRGVEGPQPSRLQRWGETWGLSRTFAPLVALRAPVDLWHSEIRHQPRNDASASICLSRPFYGSVDRFGEGNGGSPMWVFVKDVHQISPGHRGMLPDLRGEKK